MSKLPNPDEVRAIIQSKKALPQSQTPSYDLQTTHDRVMHDYNRIGFTGVTKAQFMELINPHLWNGKENSLRMGWHSIFQSITFSLFDKDELKAVVVRHSKDKEGNVIKYRTYGSKTFTPSKIKAKDEVIFVASGIGEYLLFELMDVSYIAPQSDSVTSGITPSMIDQCKGKIIVYLQDNDESGRKLAVKLQEIFCESIFIVVDFNNVLADSMQWDVKANYDYRDFCNEMSKRYGELALKAIGQMISKEIREYKRGVSYV
jgi:hypothetical protein